LWAKAECRLGTLLMGLKIQRVENKNVDRFDSMSDEELRQYVYGNQDLDS
jgi:hypothetical protein